MQWNDPGSIFFLDLLGDTILDSPKSHTILAQFKMVGAQEHQGATTKEGSYGHDKCGNLCTRHWGQRCVSNAFMEKDCGCFLKKENEQGMESIQSIKKAGGNGNV